MPLWVLVAGVTVAWDLAKSSRRRRRRPCKICGWSGRRCPDRRDGAGPFGSLRDA